MTQKFIAFVRVFERNIYNSVSTSYIDGAMNGQPLGKWLIYFLFPLLGTTFFEQREISALFSIWVCICLLGIHFSSKYFPSKQKERDSIR
jgi:hypothetical protein